MKITEEMFESDESIKHMLDVIDVYELKYSKDKIQSIFYILESALDLGRRYMNILIDELLPSRRSKLEFLKEMRHLDTSNTYIQIKNYILDL